MRLNLTHMKKHTNNLSPRIICTTNIKRNTKKTNIKIKLL